VQNMGVKSQEASDELRKRWKKANKMRVDELKKPEIVASSTNQVARKNNAVQFRFNPMQKPQPLWLCALRAFHFPVSLSFSFIYTATANTVDVWHHSQLVARRACSSEGLGRSRYSSKAQQANPTRPVTFAGKGFARMQLPSSQMSPNRRRRDFDHGCSH
jgi:hypothetical protein